VLLTIERLLDPEAAARMRERLAAAPWIDGRATAGQQSARTKRNRQLPEDHPLARELGDAVLRALAGHPRFVSAALPKRVFPPLFNRYEGGEGSARMSTTPSATTCPAVCASAPICRQRCS
jgi:Uncharacterized iron-regulated protein